MNKLVILFIIFLLIGAYLVVLRNDINLADKEGKKTFVYKFSAWIWDIGVDLKNVVGYAIHQDWLPDNPHAGDNPDNNKTIIIVAD